MGETRPTDERLLRSVEEKIKVPDSGKLSFRQEVVRKAMVAFKTGEKFKLASPTRASARRLSSICSKSVAMCCDSLPRRHVRTRTCDRRSRSCSNVSSPSTVMTSTARKKRSAT